MKCIACGNTLTPKEERYTDSIGIVECIACREKRTGKDKTMSWFSRQKDMNPESDPIQVGEWVVVDDINGGHTEEVVDVTVDGLPVIEDEDGNRGYVPEKRIRGKVRW